MSASTALQDHETAKSRPVLGLVRWRAARERGELWMYLESHPDSYSPPELTEEEWIAHLEAMVVAKKGRR